MRQDFIGLEFNGLVNTIKVMLNRSVYLTTLLLGWLSPVSDKPICVPILSQETDNCPYLRKYFMINISMKKCCQTQQD